MSREHRYADFMPAAQGLVARRASPFAGVLIVIVAVLFGGMVGFSAYAEVEQVVRATGQVEPVGRVKLLNHPEGGRVTHINVEEGRRVAAGDVLVVFDHELRTDELAELRGRHEVRAITALRLAAEAEGRPMQVPEELARRRPDLVAEQQSLQVSRRSVQANRAQAQASLVERREREVAMLAAELGRLRNSLTLLDQQHAAVRDLAEKGLYPRMRVVAVERQVSDVRGELAKAQENLEASRAALEEARTQAGGQDEEWRSQVLAELAVVSAERDRLADALRQQETRLRGLTLLAPEDGIVQEIAITAVGQSVGANETLMKLVPVGDGLVVEARVANEDIGHVHLGQKATIKVRAFDFLRHGTLEGEVAHIAADATFDARSGSFGYAVTLHTREARLGRGEGGIGGRNVVPGMVVDVEFHIGERTILSYLTDRILQIRSDVFREG